MQFVGYTKSGSLDTVDFKLHTAPQRVPKELEVLVDIKAIALNPIDYKIRKSRSGAADSPVILGWDASGVVAQAGSKVQNFKVGDEVFYSGDLTKDGCYATQQCVDHRLVAKKPKLLSFEEAAALPLTSLTAYEMLFEKMHLGKKSKQVVLIIGGAGGVGSMAIQLLKAKTDATIIATATRKESIEWVKSLGAHHVISYENIDSEIKTLGYPYVDSIFCTTHAELHFAKMLSAVAPFGEIGVIDELKNLDIGQLTMKAISLHFELMFTKSLNHYKEESQGEILGEVAYLIDEKRIATTSKLILNGLTLENIQKGHNMLENHTSIGKIVVTI